MLGEEYVGKLTDRVRKEIAREVDYEEDSGGAACITGSNSIEGGKFGEEGESG